MANELVTIFRVEDAQATRATSRFSKSLNDLNRDINNLDVRPFAEKYKSGFDDLTRRLDLTRQSFQKLAAEKLGKNQFDAISQGAFAAEKQIGRLELQVRSLKKEAADPNNAQFGKYYAQGIREAEREIARFERKIKDLNRQQNNLAGGGVGGSFGSSFGSRVAPSFPAGGSAGAILGGIAGGATVAGFGLAANAVSSLLSEVKDLTVESIKLAGNFEETTNSLAVFAGSTQNARAELAAIDKVALDTPGLRLEAAEKGYQRLRALNFEAGISRDLIKGLGTQRVLSGATSDAVDRVITNLIQLKTGAGTAADVRQTVGQLPTLLPVFQKAFGTQDFGDINRIFKTDPAALKKFTDELAKAESAQAGFNVTLEKGADALLQAGRIFGEPFLSPLTRDTKNLTELLRENESAIKHWGQTAADTYNGLSYVVSSKPGQGLLSSLGGGIRTGLAALTGGGTETALTFAGRVGEIGRLEREAEELKNRPKVFAENIAEGVNFNDVKLTLDPLTNTLKRIGETVAQTPSLSERLDAEKAAENLEKVKRELSAMPLKFALDDVSQNLEIQKAIAVRDAKGDTLNLAKQIADLEIGALKQQIELTDKIALDKIRNLSPEDLAGGKGLIVAAENEQNLFKLQNQLLLTQINLQKQIGDETEKAAEKAKKQAEDFKKLGDDFRSDLVSVRERDNPFVKTLTDIAAATDRAREKYKEFTKLFGSTDFADRLAALDARNQTKQLGAQRFENNFEALKFDQEARRLDATPERQFADFARKLDSVNRRVNFALTDNDLTRKITEAGFYAGSYDPRRPQSFAQFNRSVGIGDGTDAGLQIRAALSDINRLKTLDLNGTGLDGKEAVINKILEAIPAREELLKRIANRQGGAEAQTLLAEQANALRIKQEIERKKLRDFVEDQKIQQFGKQFAKEQIGEINSSKDLTEADKAKQRLAVTDALGNDLDPELKRQRVRDFVASAKAKREQEKEAEKYAKDLNGLVRELMQQLAGKGIKIDGSNLPKPQTNVTVKSDNGNPKVELAPGASANDTAAAYADTDSFYGNASPFGSRNNRGLLTNR